MEEPPKLTLSERRLQGTKTIPVPDNVIDFHQKLDQDRLVSLSRKEEECGDRRRVEEGAAKARKSSKRNRDKDKNENSSVCNPFAKHLRAMQARYLQRTQTKTSEPVIPTRNSKVLFDVMEKAVDIKQGQLDASMAALQLGRSEEARRKAEQEVRLGKKIDYFTWKARVSGCN